MNNMRRGFTMIELIFVIVIIGILAAVAIPKLAATRSDAEGAKIANNLATCIGDAGGWYMKNGSFTGAALEGIASIACTTGIETGASQACFTVAGADATGALTTANAGAGDASCDEAHIIAATNAASPATHNF